jgi:hypothetical protein
MTTVCRGAKAFPGRKYSNCTEELGKKVKEKDNYGCLKKL